MVINRWKAGRPYTLRKKARGGNKKYEYNYGGVPVPLIVIAREYGTSRGEAKKPFIRPAFKKAMIEEEMLKIQKKYIKDDGNE